MQWTRGGRVMDHGARSRELTTIATPFNDNRKRSGAAMRRFIPFCLAVLLGSAAADQSNADGGLPPPDAKRSDISIQTEPAVEEQQRALEQERFKADALQRELVSARMELILTISKAVDSLKASSDREEYLRRE